MGRHQQSQETRDKISAALRDQWRRGIRSATRPKGFKMSEVQKRRIGLANSVALRGNKPSLASIRKGVAARQGYRHSDDVRRRIGSSNSIAQRGKVLSVETRSKISQALKSRREQSHLWKGGITPINQSLRRGLRMRLWREAVFKRDDYTCQECGVRGGQLEAHHIKPFSSFPEQRFDIDNGQTLCKPCHKLTPTYLNKAIGYLPS